MDATFIDKGVRDEEQGLVSAVIPTLCCRGIKALALSCLFCVSFERLKAPDVSRCGMRRLGSTFSLLSLKNPLDVFGRDAVGRRFLGASAGTGRFTVWLVISTSGKGWGR